MKRPPRSREASSDKSSLSGALVVLVLKLVWAAFVVSTPVLGAWLASSLAAYQGGHIALAALTGVLLFPVIPLAWDGYARYRRRRKQKGVVKPAILTFWDRFILRTLAVNLVFLGAMLATHPEAAFAALSTRGDWMLEGRHAPWAESARRALFKVADRLEWLYLAARPNPFEKKDDGGSTTATASASSTSGNDVPPPRPTADATAKQDAPKPPPKPETPDNKPPPAGPPSEWPMAPTLHPAVASMPPSSEESLQSVARYIADRESDPLRRAKAVHDYVADRIAYDAVAYQTRNFPPQDAETVFRARKGVCAGYAQLFAALARLVGVDAAYVVGDARTQGMKETGESHAWNAIKVGGRSYLLDVTWDSGSVDGTTFTKQFRTDYFLTPPEVFGIDHFPDEPGLQLREKPISRGDFMRQPMMSPRFYAESRQLLSPTRSQVSVKGSAVIEIKNPKGLHTLADFVAAGREKGDPCKVDGADPTRIQCDLPAEGSYRIMLFSNAEKYGSYAYIGQIEVNNAP